MPLQVLDTVTGMRPVCFVMVSMALVLSSSEERAAEPDFAAAHSEVLENLRAFVRIETVNPPGNETRAAEFLKGLLDKEGIPSEVIAADPKRGNLIARLKGSGKKPPLLLMGHTDVVGVERTHWTVEPFEGLIKDGYLYGRGSFDDKCMTTVCLEVFLLIHRLHLPLDRDIIFLAEADEEGGGGGIRYLIEHNWDKISCEYALNEGGAIVEEGQVIKYVGVATSEKVPHTLLMSATGSSGHASIPRPDNAVVHLAAAIAKIGAWQPPMRLNETTRRFFDRLALISSTEDARLFTEFRDPVAGPRVQEMFRSSPRLLFYNAMLRTSVSPTFVKAGFKYNVIPGDAMAALDVRALPEEDVGALLKTLNDVVNDPAVTITPAGGGLWPSAPPSPLDSAMYASLERAQRRVFPASTMLPVLLPAATDSAFLRAKGVAVYGLGSVYHEAEDGRRIHGNDERVQIAGIRPFIELVYLAVSDVAGVQKAPEGANSR